MVDNGFDAKMGRIFKLNMDIETDLGDFNESNRENLLLKTNKKYQYYAMICNIMLFLYDL